jgi:predicted dehydrogenase
MERRFSVAVVGTGIGAAHIEGLSANPDSYRVAVVCDLDADRAAALASAASDYVNSQIIHVDGGTLAVL